MCARGRAKYIEINVLHWLESTPRAKFITLTLKHSNAPLVHQISTLYKHFRSLRANKDFKSYVQGGIWFFQVKFSGNDGCWHPHIHLAAQSRYFAQKQLSRLWVGITLTSNIVDIRSVKNLSHAAKYVARYAAKPAKLAGLSEESRLELAEAMHGRRIAGAFGSAREVSLKPEPLKDKADWHRLGNFRTIMGLSREDKAAYLIVAAWLSKSRLDNPADFTNIDRFIDSEGADPYPTMDIESEDVWQSTGLLNH